MTDRLAGKTIVATASGQGIGRATALAFARAGATVWATDINEDSLASLAKESANIQTRVLDVCDYGAIKALAKEVGTIDVLFNCAGYVASDTALTCNDAEWDKSFDINVKSMYHMIQAFLPGMIAKGKGTIVNISSVAGAVTGVQNRYSYSATKAAVMGLTKALAADFVKQGIRAVAVCPGTIHSPSLEQRINATPDPKKTWAEFNARQPMGRLGTPEDVAAACVYLASDEASFVTGSIHLVDGGWTM
jgi:2-keto-3-deoxy-L-fuconate dehydrogenase